MGGVAREGRGGPGVPPIEKCRQISLSFSFCHSTALICTYDTPWPSPHTRPFYSAHTSLPHQIAMKGVLTNMNNNGRASNNKYYLGEDDYIGDSIDQVSSKISDGYTHNDTLRCIVCKQPAHARLLPKTGILPSDKLAREGYVCNSCAHFYSKEYAIVPLDRYGN